MNKIGILYAYWTRNWSVDFHPFIDKTDDLGFDVLEVQTSELITVKHNRVNIIILGISCLW